MLKRMAVCLVAVVFALTMAMPAFADDANIVQPRAAVCGNCGVGLLFETNIRILETGPVYTPCTHKPRGEDKTWRNVKYYQLKCNNAACGFLSGEMSADLGVSRIECHGYY